MLGVCVRIRPILGIRRGLTLDLLSIKDEPFGVKGPNNHPCITQSTDINLIPNNVIKRRWDNVGGTFR